jgi:hypothetical protein
MVGLEDKVMQKYFGNEVNDCSGIDEKFPFNRNTP